MSISWIENNATRSSKWQSEAGVKAPQKVLIADDSIINADTAYRLACEGTAILWRGDFQMHANCYKPSLDVATKKSHKKFQATQTTLSPKDAFNLHRLAQAQRARILGMLLIEVGENYLIDLKRAPNIEQACTEAYGGFSNPFVVSLREIQALIGAHEWRKKGVTIASLHANIHPHYGVFSPIRGEYLELVEKAPLPSTQLAFDIGTGTGVIAALLAKRGIKKIIATDQDARALACAKDNIDRLDLSHQITLQQTNMFPEGKAPLIVCNPPWVPAKPSSPIEYAIYDPENCMLLAFLNDLKNHLETGGEGWLIMSDFAEHLGLRESSMLPNAIHSAGLEVIEKIDIAPKHGKVMDMEDPLHEARKKEITSLWRLGVNATSS